MDRFGDVRVRDKKGGRCINKTDIAGRDIAYE